MRIRAPYRLLVLASAIPLMCLQAAAQDGGYLLKRTYAKGEAERFTTNLKITSGSEAGGPKIEVEIVIDGTETVKEVKPDGSTVIETRIDKAVMSAAGQKRDLPGGGQQFTTVLDKDGAVAPSEAGAGSQTGFSPSQMLALTRLYSLPGKPFNIGDEHKFEMKGAESGKETRSVKGLMKVLSLDKKSAELRSDAIKVKFIVDATVPPVQGVPLQTVHVDGLQWVEPGSGRILLATGKVTGVKSPILGDATLEFKQVRTLTNDPARPGSEK